MSHLLKLIPLEERIVLDAAAAAVIYVNVHATGSVHNGDSWATAYTDLQSALTAAATENSHPVQIWVAKGTYTPNQIYTPPGFVGTPTANMDTFNLPNNVQLIGGFAGNETSVSQSNPTQNPTILNGQNTDWHVVTAIDVTASLSGLTVTGGYANGPDQVINGSVYSFNSGGGLYAVSGANITLNNDIFSNDSAGNSSATEPTGFNPGGGAVFATNVGTEINVINSQFLNNVGSTNQLTWGGALLINPGASLDISNSLFQGNTTYYQGGAIVVVDAGHLNISNSQFLNNSATGGILLGIPGGGAIADANTNTSISNSIFSQNSAWFGGGIATASEGALPGGSVPMHFSILNSVFENNSAGFRGGGWLSSNIAGAGLTTTMTGDLFLNNTALSGGGGGVDNDSAALNVNQCTFIGNVAQGMGGAMLLSSESSTVIFNQITGVVTVSNSTFINNVAQDSAQAHITTNLVFEELFGLNAVFSSGGGAIDNNGNGILTLSNDSFINNQSINADGGAILNGGWYLSPIGIPSVVFDDGGTVTITNSLFGANQAINANGGAIATESNAGIGLNTAVSTTISGSVILANSATDNGGGMYVDYAVASITDNLFAFNTAAVGRGIYAAASQINGLSDSCALASLESQNIFIDDNIVLV